MRATSFLLCAVIVTTAGGCMPHVLHGPRVEEGVSGQVSLTFGRNLELDDDEDFRTVPSLYIGGRRSHVNPDTTSAALTLGLQVPALLLPAFFGGGFSELLATSYFDLYLQPRRRPQPGGLESGIGALGSLAMFAPYVQVGWLDDEGDGLYTTQLVTLPTGGYGGFPTLYLPTIAYRDHDPVRNLTANWSITAGIMLEDDEASTWLVMLGGSFEFGRRPRTP